MHESESQNHQVFPKEEQATATETTLPHSHHTQAISDKSRPDKSRPDPSPEHPQKASMLPTFFLGPQI